MNPKRTFSPDPKVKFSDIFPRHFAQGARCGHIDGKARCGIYVLQEEQFDSLDAAEAQNFNHPGKTTAWMLGYEAGYRVGADGEELDEEIINEELP